MPQFINEAKRFQKLAGIITENETPQIPSELANDPNFKKLVAGLANDPNFKKLVAGLKANPEAAKEIDQELKESLDEKKYFDYSDDTPKEISKKEYWVRKLKTAGLTALAGALAGVAMAGGLKADDVLQMALAAAAGGGAIGSTLISTVGGENKNEQ